MQQKPSLSMVLGKKKKKKKKKKEIHYSIIAEMILARPSPFSSQHTLSPTSGTARFAYVPRELPPRPAT